MASKKYIEKYIDQSVAQLVKLSQSLGVQSDLIRAQRKDIKAAIDAKLPKVAPGKPGQVAYVVPDAPKAASKRK